MIRFQALGDPCEESTTNLQGLSWPATIFKSPTIYTLRKVFTNVRHKLNRSEDEKILDQRWNVLMWELFMSTTMKAAVHLGQTYNENLITCRNTNFEELKMLFDVTQKLILDQNFEILTVATH